MMNVLSSKNTMVFEVYIYIYIYKVGEWVSGWVCVCVYMYVYLYQTDLNIPSHLNIHSILSDDGI